MFWKFNKYSDAPPPWGASGSPYNVPVELQQASFMKARTGMTPTFADRFAAFFATPMRKRMVSPMRAYGAMSKHPADAFGVVQAADDHLHGLADYALSKHLQGLPLSMDEGKALIAVHMPPVVRPRERCGPGVVPDWDVPFCDRSSVPSAVRDQQAFLTAPAEAQRQLAVGHEIAMIEAIRNRWVAQSGGGRGR